MSLKICYIWVDNFRNFKDFGFNLSGFCKFHFNSKDHYLTSNNTDPLPNDFFGNSISDVIGIIGKNGSGKSNAVELVCKVLKGAKSSINSDFLFVIEENGHFICYYSFQVSISPKSSLKIQFQEYNGSINPLKVVFFSNVFDERKNEFDKEVTDISVNNLFRRNIFLRKEKFTDFEKQIRLIDSKIFPSLNIDLPTKVQLTSKVWINRFNASMERNLYSENFESIRELKSIFRDRLREIRPENKFIHLFRFGFFFDTYNNYFRNNRFRGNDLRDIKREFEEFIPSLFKLRTEDISENMIYFLKKEFLNTPPPQPTLFFEHDNIRDYENEFEKFKRQIDFLLNLKFLLSELNLAYNTEGARNRSLEYFTFEYDSKVSKSFINEYITLFGQSNVFEINWLGISSGHKAYLNLFSSLYQELRYTRQPNLLLCIDEGDLYLHPMWQTEFFDKLLSVLPVIYAGKVQLILTSHSPFLLSDLPKQNITILDKDIIGSSKNGVDLKNNTFGGNLYDLYSEPFFLGKKRTSDFAYNKIKELIKSIENKDISKSKKDALLQVANIIGDEIIQFQIKKLLNND